MKVGIDLDNTIMSYDRAFQMAAYDRGLIDSSCEYTKQELSQKIRSRKNGEIEWQRLQGYVYGKGIKKAHIFPGVYRFLWRCCYRGIGVEVVSHKTEYGHYDAEKHSLREATIQFLHEHKILQDNSEKNRKKLINKITFTDTQQDKINYILDNNFDYFIDDLEEIVKSKELTNIKLILFNGRDGASWDEINSSLLNDWTKGELLRIIKELLPEKEILSIEKIYGRGNAEIYKIITDKKIYVSKIYSQSGKHDRVIAEYSSLKLLNELSVPYVQTPVACDNNFGAAVYDYIEGESVSNYDNDDVQQMLSLLAVLDTQTVRDRFSDFNLASNACLSGADIESQIEDRVKKFETAIDVHIELKSFIHDSFIPALSDILIWSKKNWPNSFTKELDRRDLILSPSDFGFHNAIKDKTGKLFFHDFEYFGWDDPVKLISDVSHHAAFEFSEELEQLWVDGCLKMYDESVLYRYRVAWPLYGLIWCLIILNEYNNSIWEKRVKANATLKNKREYVLLIQLNKAKKQLNKVLDKYDKIRSIKR